MSRTFVSQPTQVFNSELYNDHLSNGSQLSSSAVNIQDDLNGIRTQVKLLLYGNQFQSGSFWYDNVVTITSGSTNYTGRGLIGSGGVDGGLVKVENKGFLYRLEHTGTIFVSASQNWVRLERDELPPQVFTYGDVIYGVPVGKLQSVYNLHSFALSSGSHYLYPKNMVLVSTASSGQALHSVTNGDREIFGLLQVQSASVDGNSFTGSLTGLPDSGQMSFVCQNAAGTALVAVPVAEIAGKRLQYAYNTRTGYTSIPEDAWVTQFQDFDTAVSATNLESAIQAQGGTAFTGSFSVDWLIQTNQHVSFRSGTSTIFRIDVNGGGSIVSNVDNFNINNVNTVNFTKGASFNTASNFINVGVTSGQIDASGSLTLRAVNALLVLTGQGITFADAFNAASTHTGSIPFSTSSGDWTSYQTNFGDLSLLAALNRVGERVSGIAGSISGSSRIATGVAVVTASITALTNLTTLAGSKNLSGSLPAYTPSTFDGKTIIYLNGIRQYQGSTNDVVPGTSSSLGDLKFTYDVRGGSIIQVDVYS